MSILPALHVSSKTPLKIRIEPGQHWLIAGITGTGKTFLARELLYLLARSKPFAECHFYFLDEKDEGDFKDFPGHVTSSSPPAPLQEPHNCQVWHPEDYTPADIEAWLEQVYKDKPAVLVIDELTDCIYGPRKYSQALKKLLKKGRGKGITVIVLTQEAAEIPRQTIGQTSHWIRFAIGNPYDSNLLDKKIRNSIGEPDAKYGFFYNFRESRRGAWSFPSVQHFLGGSK